MRILIISYYFPPYNTIGAVRVGKMAKYLHTMGHEIMVVSAKDQPLQPTLEVEIPSEKVIYTDWININAIPMLFLGGRDKIAAKGFSIDDFNRNLLRCLGNVYKMFLNFPDGQIGWYPYGVRAARQLLKTWRPDIIYASAIPYTSLLIAYKISQEYHLPWVAEFRDLWTDHHHYIYPGMRRRIEQKLERKILKTAKGAVTVSKPLAEILRRKYDIPVKVILNGFDPEDFDNCPLSASHNDDKRLKIVYTGSVYEGKRDPTPLFVALKSMGINAVENINVEFYGRYLGVVADLSKKYCVENLVNVCPSIPYREALAKQKSADVLLLLLWNDFKEKGVYSGKLFEYLGARRPILAIGPEDNVAANLIIERSAGVVATDPKNIADALNKWCLMKKEGIDFSIKHSMLDDLTRRYQTAILANFLEDLLMRHKD